MKNENQLFFSMSINFDYSYNFNCLSMFSGYAIIIDRKTQKQKKIMETNSYMNASNKLFLSYIRENY